MLVKESYKLAQVNSMPASMLDEMLLLIKTNLPESTVTHELVTRSKFILTELLTNAIKHANADDTNIRIEATKDSIRFIKSDNGTPFKAPHKENSLFKNAHVIATDIMHTLYAVDRNGELHFYCYENREPLIDISSDFPEHFGLLIITKASDDFYYTYDPDTKLNFFVAAVNL